MSLRNMRTKIMFNPAKLAELKKARDAAHLAGKEVFLFDGAELFVPYADYVIEYLEMRFNSQECPVNAPKRA